MHHTLDPRLTLLLQLLLDMEGVPVLSPLMAGQGGSELRAERADAAGTHPTHHKTLDLSYS